MENNRLNKFGKELGRFLDYYNISINEFAERIDTTPKNLIEIIDGKVSLSFNIICNIAFISGISADYIFNVEEGFKIDKNARMKVEDIMRKAMDVENFGNGRFVENTVQKIIIEHAKNTRDITETERLLTFTEEDISDIKAEESRKRIGF